MSQEPTPAGEHVLAADTDEFRRALGQFATGITIVTAIDAEHDGGDHVIVVGRVLDLGITHDAGPLLYFRGRYERMA